MPIPFFLFSMMIAEYHVWETGAILTVILPVCHHTT